MAITFSLSTMKEWLFQIFTSIISYLLFTNFMQLSLNVSNCMAIALTQFIVTLTKILYFFKINNLYCVLCCCLYSTNNIYGISVVSLNSVILTACHTTSIEKYQNLIQSDRNAKRILRLSKLQTEKIGLPFLMVILTGWWSTLHVLLLSKIGSEEKEYSSRTKTMY